MIDRAHWIDKNKLIKFIIDCQVCPKLNELSLSFSLTSRKPSILHLSSLLRFQLQGKLFDPQVILLKNCRTEKMEEFQIDLTMLWMSSILTLELQVFSNLIHISSFVSAYPFHLGLVLTILITKCSWPCET